MQEFSLSQRFSFLQILVKALKEMEIIIIISKVWYFKEWTKIQEDSALQWFMMLALSLYFEKKIVQHGKDIAPNSQFLLFLCFVEIGSVPPQVDHCSLPSHCLLLKRRN